MAVTIHFLRCEECGHQWTVKMEDDEKPQLICPECCGPPEDDITLPAD